MDAKITLSAVDQTKAAFESAKRNLSSIGDTAGALPSKFGTIGLAISAAFAAVSYKGAIDTLDQLDDLREKTGIAVESLSTLRYAGEVAGTPLEAIAKSSRVLATAMADVSTGNKEAVATFQSLGIQVRGADGAMRSQDAVLLDLADKFSGYADGASKSALATRVFGKSGQEMIPLLNLGSDGIKRMRGEAESLGAVYGGDVARNAAAFNDNLKRLELASEAAKVSLLSGLIPSLVRLTDELIEGKKAFGGYLSALYQIGFKTSPFASYAEGANTARAEVQRLDDQISKLQSNNSRTTEENGGGAAFVGPSTGRSNNAALIAKLTAQRAVEQKRLSYFETLNGKDLKRAGDQTEESYFGRPQSKPDAPTPSDKSGNQTAAATYIAGLAKEYGALTATTSKYDEVQEYLRINGEKFTAGEKAKALALAKNIDVTTKAAAAVDALARTSVAELDAQEKATDAHYAAVQALEKLNLDQGFELSLLNKLPDAIALARFQRDLDNQARTAEAALVARGLQAGWDEIRMMQERAKITREASDTLGKFKAIQSDSADKLFNPNRGVAEALKEYNQEIAQGGEAAKQATQRSLGGIEDALTDLASKGKTDIKSLVDTMLSEFMRLQVVRPLMAQLFGPGGSGANGLGMVFGAGGSAGGGAFSQLFNSFRYGTSNPGATTVQTGAQMGASFAADFASYAVPLAKGMDNVPYDGFPAILHKNERVLTSSENASYGESASSSVTYNFGNGVSRGEVLAGLQMARAGAVNDVREGMRRRRL